VATRRPPRRETPPRPKHPKRLGPPKSVTEAAAASSAATSSAPKGKTAEQRQREEWEAKAKELIADGYNSSVVTRKMITEFNMPEDEAEALVGGMLGKKVSARSGDTLYRIWGGLFAMLVGFAGAWWFYDGWGMAAPIGEDLLSGFWLWKMIPCLGLMGFGFSQIIMAFANHGVKDDLRDHRRHRSD
jgi:hypothetical protein